MFVADAKGAQAAYFDLILLDTSYAKSNNCKASVVDKKLIFT